MTHRIKPGTRYCFTEGGQVLTNDLPHDIIVDQKPIFLGGTVTIKNVRMSFPHLKRPSESAFSKPPADAGTFEVTGRPVVDAPKEIQERAKAIIPKGADIKGILIHPATGLLTVECYASVGPLGTGLYCIKETLEQHAAYYANRAFWAACAGRLVTPDETRRRIAALPIGGIFDGVTSRQKATRAAMCDLLARGGQLIPNIEDTMTSPFPAFVPPERPTAPAEPAPTPDTPAVATLRALLTDRQCEVVQQERNVGYAKDTVAMCTTDLAEAERDLQAAKDDLAYRETVAAAAAAEVETIKADIVKLGGTV